MGSLQGKRFLVTGGAVRIGRAICECLVRGGATVIVHYHDSGDQARELVRELDAIIPGNSCLQADLTDDRECRELIPQALAQAGGLNGLINNASVYRRGRMADLDASGIRRDYTINLIAPLVLMREFHHNCKAGCIINLLDQRVARVDAGAGSYGLAKKSLRDATEAAAVEWAPMVRVNGVAPGIVLPPPGVAAGKMKPLLANVPMQRQSTPEEVAAACVFLLQAETITGHILFVDGGMHLADMVQPERN